MVDIDTNKINGIKIFSNECCFNGYHKTYIGFMMDEEKQEAYDFYSQIPDKYKHTAEFKIDVLCSKIQMKCEEAKPCVIAYPLHLCEFIKLFNVLPNHTHKEFDVNKAHLEHNIINKNLINNINE